VEFARPFASSKQENKRLDEINNGGDDEEMSIDEKVERSKWLVAGSKDNRVSIWSLMSFEK